MSYFKAFIRIVKSLQDPNSYWMVNENIVEERLIEAKDTTEVKKFLLEKHPQFFQNGKVYSKETKDPEQFFYVVIFPLYSWEIEKVLNPVPWECSYCGQVHENEYISRPKQYPRLYGEMRFCQNNGDHSCMDEYKKKQHEGIDLPDDDWHITQSSPNYIYRVTEKATGKCYIGKTRNAPFFRWWNHLTHSSSPFGLYLRGTRLSEWTFEVLTELPPDTPDTEVFRIESEYMVQYDSIHNGFNSVISNKNAMPVVSNQTTLL